jgi:hypothetical protein
MHADALESHQISKPPFPPALKGRNKLAQGTALGFATKKAQAL